MIYWQVIVRPTSLATWCKEPTHWKRPWCWETLKAREENNRGWDGWMASPTQWPWVWANSRRWWRTGKPGVPRVSELDMTEGVNRNNKLISGLMICPTNAELLAEMWFGKESREFNISAYWKLMDSRYVLHKYHRSTEFLMKSARMELEILQSCAHC